MLLLVLFHRMAWFVESEVLTPRPLTSLHWASFLNPPLSLSIKVSTMVSEALRQRLLPFVNREYGNIGAVTLEEQDVYVEHYQANHEVARAAWRWTRSTRTLTLRIVALSDGGRGVLFCRSS